MWRRMGYVKFTEIEAIETNKGILYKVKPERTKLMTMLKRKGLRDILRY